MSVMKDDKKSEQIITDPPDQDPPENRPIDFDRIRAQQARLGTRPYSDGDRWVCEYCGVRNGYFVERGFKRCNNCGEPGQ